MKKTQVFYYESEKDDFFSQSKKLPKIDENYKYHKGFFGRLFEFIMHRIIAPPLAFFYLKLIVREKCYGKNKLAPYKKQGYFIFLNHTQAIIDALSPNIMIFPKKLRIIVNKENLALPVLGQATKYLGAIPLPDNLKATKNFAAFIKASIEKGDSIAIYPEAHVWPYYTKIREFGEESVELVTKVQAPVFTATRVYKSSKGSKKPRQELYIDGPFFFDTALPKREARKKLRDEIISAMKERAALSDIEWIKYLKKDNEEGAD